MPLTCYCADDDFSWYYEYPEDYSTMPTLPRRKRCASCRVLIDPGVVVAKFIRYRHPVSEIEEKIYGEGGEIDLASAYQCERCADLWFSLHELGFCVSPDESMPALAKEYASTYGARR